MFDFLTETLASEQLSTKSGRNETLSWHRPTSGVIAFEPNQESSKSVVISAAIHGNETAPVEILAELVSAILNGKYRLKVRLLVIFGNLDAMRQGKRYLKIDLNRLFSDHYQKYEDCCETRRAAILQRVVSDFYAAQPTKKRLHFDLHTAIRSSHHRAFGLLPYLESGHYNKPMIDWLQGAAIEALVINNAPASTFSYFTSNAFAAHSCTLELGKANPFGENDLQQFTAIKNGLINLITAINIDNTVQSEVIIYKVTNVLTKLSEQFNLNFAEDIENFTAFPKGFVLATDLDVKYRVEAEQEYILFPNNHVKIGFRAGLVLIKDNLSSLTDN